MVSPEARIDVDVDDHPYEYYTCGDVIRGSVRVHPTVRPEKVNVFFRAQCKMRVLNKERGGDRLPEYEEKLLLFSYGRRLFESSQAKTSYEIVEKGIGEDGKVKLPFLFIFPRDVPLKCTAEFEVRRQFENEPGHTLPPTSSFHSAFSGHVVEYWVEAQVLGDRAYRSVQTLPFRSPTPPIDQTHLIHMPSNGLGDICVSSRKLHPDYDSNEKFFRKIKNSLTASASQVPWVKWQLIARVPSTLFVGVQIPVTLSLQYIGGSTELLGIPAVFIRRAKITLVQKLTTRVVKWGYYDHRDLDGSNSVEMVLFDRKFTENDMLLYDGQQFVDFGDASIPKMVCPSFKTYSARLEYAIRIMIEGDCSKESFKVVACEGDCTIVCYTSREPPTSEQTLGSEDSPPSIDPPPYEHT